MVVSAFGDHMLARLRPYGGWLVLVECGSAVLGVLLMLWAGLWWPVALTFAGFAVLMLGERWISAWNERRLLRSLRGGIKRVRGKSIIPSSYRG